MARLQSTLLAPEAPERVPRDAEAAAGAAVIAAQSTPPARIAPEAFEDFFDAHFSYVWRTLARLGIAEPDREDLANEVFFQVHRRLPTADVDRPLRPWLFAFVFRIASSHRRLARHRFERMGDIPDVADSAPRADETIERREAETVVDRGLAEIPLDQRAVFVLHEIDGVAVPEIATALGIPLNTAYSRLRLARTHFAATVRRIANLEGGS